MRATGAGCGWEDPSCRMTNIRGCHPMNVWTLIIWISHHAESKKKQQLPETAGLWVRIPMESSLAAKWPVQLCYICTYVSLQCRLSGSICVSSVTSLQAYEAVLRLAYGHLGPIGGTCWDTGGLRIVCRTFAISWQRTPGLCIPWQLETLRILILDMQYSTLTRPISIMHSAFQGQLCLQVDLSEPMWAPSSYVTTGSQVGHLSCQILGL